MNAAQVCMTSAFACIAIALVSIGWLLNRLGRRLTALEDRVKIAETNHRTLVGETRQAFQGWAAASDPTPSTAE